MFKFKCKVKWAVADRLAYPEKQNTRTTRSGCLRVSPETPVKSQRCVFEATATRLAATVPASAVMISVARCRYSPFFAKE